MKIFVTLFALILVYNACPAMSMEDVLKLPREQQTAYFDARAEAAYPNELYYVPNVPRKLALAYFNQLNTHHRNFIHREDGRFISFGNAHMYCREHRKTGDSCALLIERYCKTTIAKAFAGRSPQLETQETGPELEQALTAVHADLKDLTYIALGETSQTILTQSLWQEYWDTVKQAVTENIPLAFPAIGYTDPVLAEKVKQEQKLVAEKHEKLQREARQRIEEKIKELKRKAITVAEDTKKRKNE